MPQAKQTTLLVCSSGHIIFEPHVLIEERLARTDCLASRGKATSSEHKSTLVNHGPRPRLRSTDCWHTHTKHWRVAHMLDAIFLAP